jgi:SAM-dependent methyltransferase
MAWSDAISNLTRLWRDAGWSGVRAAVRDRVVERYYEWHFGVETGNVISTRELGFAGQDYHYYVATEYDGLFALLRHLQLGSSDVFLDYGCGKGRAVVVAATFPLARVIGVEVSDVLAAQAEQNLARAARRLRCHQVAIIRAAAENYEIPDTVSIAYFYNPFSGDVLTRTFDRLRASLRRRARRLRLVCRLPEGSAFAASLALMPDLAPLGSYAPRPDRRYLLFELCP